MQEENFSNIVFVVDINSNQIQLKSSVDVFSPAGVTLHMKVKKVNVYHYFYEIWEGKIENIRHY